MGIFKALGHKSDKNIQNFNFNINQIFLPTLYFCAVE